MEQASSDSAVISVCVCRGGWGGAGVVTGKALLPAA